MTLLPLSSHSPLPLPLPPPILSPMDLGSSKSPRAFGQGFAKPSGSLLEDSKSSRWGGGGVKERATFAFLADL